MLLKIAVCFLLFAKVASDSHGGQWNFKVEYDVPFNLSCMAMDMKEKPDTSTKTMRWILPSGDLVESFNQDHDRVKVHMDGLLLSIKEIKDEDFGQYYCLIHDARTGQYSVVKKGINIDGPYWGDLTAKYRFSIIVGSVAAAIVFVLMIGICYLFERNPAPGRDSVLLGDHPTKSDLEKIGYDNAAIEMEATENNHEVHVADAKYRDITHVHVGTDDSPNTHL